MQIWKIGIMFCFTSKKLSTLKQSYYSNGQKNLMRPLQWGIVRLCSLNTFGDTVKNMKIFTFQFIGVLKDMTKNGENCRRDRIDFLAISPTIF